MPLIAAEDGKWLVPRGFQPLLKPGGHGAIWKLMQDEGVFDWLYQHDREAAIVRQIRYLLCLAASADGLRLVGQVAHMEQSVCVRS